MFLILWAIYLYYIRDRNVSENKWLWKFDICITANHKWDKQKERENILPQKWYCMARMQKFNTN